MNTNLSLLKKNLDLIIPQEGLAEKLAWSNQHQKPLKIKLGFDPTAPDLHLGHAVVLKKMRQFQQAGHQIIIIIGDFTASIGDPTGRNKTRAPLSHEAIQSNAQTYLDQLSKLLDLSKTQVYYNSKWLAAFTLKDMIQLISHMTLSQMLQREDFNTRYQENSPIYLHELMYPILQGYDSVHIEADIEMGGTDQMFNCLVGRDLQHIYQKNQQIVACVPILRGTDGVHKMSKSLKNYIAFTDEPHNMYGKVMSIPDHLIEEYVCLISTFSQTKIEEIQQALKESATNPMEIKKELAFDIVEQFHSKDAAEKSAAYFYRHVQAKDEANIDFQPVHLSHLGLKMDGLTLLGLCSALLPSRSKGEIRRLIEGGGVSLNSDKITQPQVLIPTIVHQDFTLKIGKREFYHIHIDTSSF